MSFHGLKKRSRAIVKFKCRKRRQNVICNRDNLKNKSSDLTQLKLSGKVFISGSMSYENHQLAYKCRQSKTAAKIHSTCFFNNTLKIKVTVDGPVHKISHVVDIDKLLITC